MPARIVFAIWGSYGDTFPYLGIARALKARGHTSVLVMPEYYGPLAVSEGLEWHPIVPDIDPANRVLIGRLMDPARGSEVIIRELLLPVLTEAVERVRVVSRDADLVVTHPVTFAGRIGAELANRPWLSTVLSPLSFFSVDDPPALPRLPATIHLRRLGVWWPRLLMRLARQATASWCEPVRALRTRLGLPPVGHPLFEGQFSPLGTLALFSRVLGAPQRDWPPRTLTTGFVFHDGVGAPSPEVDAFLDEGPPPVVFTLGSSAVGAPGRFFEESIAAVAALGVRAILIIGPYPDNRPPGALPRDVLVTDVASHHRLFPRAAVIVHHGGIGTMGQALRSGCPMLVVPHAHDQPDNAYRAGRLGVARTVWPPAYRARRIARELSRLLGDGYRARAADVARAVGAEGGAGTAADAIEETLATVAGGLWPSREA